MKILGMAGVSRKCLLAADHGSEWLKTVIDKETRIDRGHINAYDLIIL
jgi:hypothetical protein